MNDPREFLYAKEHCRAAIFDRSIDVVDPVRGMAGISMTQLEQETLMLIGCLTRQRDAPQQWLKYADEGRGCVIGIDAEYLAHDAGVAIRTVNYDVAYLRKVMRSGLLMLQSEYQKKPPDYKELVTLSRFFAADLFAFKEHAFAQEQEVRISRMVNREATETHGYRDVGGHDRNRTPLPALPLAVRTNASGDCLYMALPLNQGDAQGVRSIGFGPHCLESARQELLEQARRLSHSVDIWQSTVDLP